MKKLLIVFSGLMIFFSCTKKSGNDFPENTIQENTTEFIRKALQVHASDSPTHGTIILGAIRKTSGSGDVTYSLNGDFFSSTSRLLNQRIEVGQVDYGSLSVNADLANDKAYYLSNTQATNQSNSSNFGATKTVSIGGNSGLGISPFSENIYVPKIVTLNGPFSANTIGSHSKVSNMSVTWNTDANNSNDMRIMLAYDIHLSNLDDSTLSDSSNIVVLQATDNGSYTIPSSTFNQFQVGSTIRLIVGRLNAGVKLQNGYKFHIIGYSYGEALFKLTN